MSVEPGEISVDMVKKLMSLGLTNEQFAAVMLMIADVIDANSTPPALLRHREKGRERAARRRAIMDVSESEWYGLRNAVLRRDGEVCAYCGDTDGPHHTDHVVPLSRGGESALTNLVVACYACNASKRDKLVDEWAGR